MHGMGGGGRGGKSGRMMECLRRQVVYNLACSVSAVC